jgi:plastocyanin
MVMLSDGFVKKRRVDLSVLMTCLLSAGAVMPAHSVAATYTIVMQGVAFVPETVTVKQGDTVVWINKDPFPHTATAHDRSFDSREMEPDKTWKYVARKKGKIPYVCTLHPTMKGTLVVE